MQGNSHREKPAAGHGAWIEYEYTPARPQPSSGTNEKWASMKDRHQHGPGRRWTWAGGLATAAQGNTGTSTDVDLWPHAATMRNPESVVKNRVPPATQHSGSM